MSTQHDQFLARLENSRPAVEAVGDWLRRGGRAVDIPPLSFASSPDVAWLYSDRGDIIFPDGRVVEVKGLGFNFPPWPFNEALITKPERLELGLDVIAYVFVSLDLRAAGIVLPETRDRWYITRSRRKNTGNIEASWTCRLDCVIWRRIK